jgi:hypothetical protein
MSVLVDNDSVTVSNNKEFMFPLMLFIPSLLGMLLYLYSFPALLKWVLIFFFVAFLSGLIAHLNSFLNGEDMFLWKVDRFGFYFQAQRTNLFSLKTPVPHPWSKIIKVLYVKKYTTLDHELDSITIKNTILLFGISSKGTPKILEYPCPGKIGFELFKVMKALAPYNTVFESLEKYNDS